MMIPKQNPLQSARTALPWPWLVAIVLHGILGLLYLLLCVGALLLPGHSVSSQRWGSEDQIFASILLGLAVLHLLIGWGLARQRPWGWILSMIVDAVMSGVLALIANRGALFFSETAQTFSQDASIVGWLWAFSVIYGINLGLVILGWIARPPQP